MIKRHVARNGAKPNLGEVTLVRMEIVEVKLVFGISTTFTARRWG